MILAYGGREWLERFLPALIQTDYPALTVWVVDNGSQPSLVPWLREKFSSIQLLRYETNEGYAGGYQRFFVEHGREVPYLCLLNSDVEVTPGWLKPLIQRMEEYPEIGAIQPKILSWSDRQVFDYAGAAGGMMDAWGYPTCRGRNERDKGQYDQPAQIFWASGAAFVVRTQAIYRSLGGVLFKPYYFMHMEEIDLCWRLQRAGWVIAYEPASIVYHVGGASLGQGDPRKTYLNFRNNLYLLWENLSPGERAIYLLRRLFLDSAVAFYLGFTQGLSHFQAVFRAYRDFWRQRHSLSFSDLPYLPFNSLTGVLSSPHLWASSPYELPSLSSGQKTATQLPSS
ncbi:MAG: glycosyltransferase [Bacteroidia bacterium]|nr:glycosyltransferase [Bacteroidia bacterium]